MPSDFYDLYGFGIIAGGIAAMTFIGSRDDRDHSAALEYLECPLFVIVAPCIVGVVALLFGDSLDALCCFVATIGVGSLWLGVVMTWLCLVV
jgi:hypothetical protein